MWDYDAFPVWDASTGVSWRSVPISRELWLDLQVWSDQLTRATMESADDPVYWSVPPATIRSWNERGHRLAERLSIELGAGYEVVFVEEHSGDAP